MDARQFPALTGAPELPEFSSVVYLASPPLGWTITYTRSAEWIRGTIDGNEVIRFHLDTKTGLVMESQSVTFNGQPAPKGTDWIKSSFGAPILGTYYDGALFNPFNPIPAPKWLASDDNILGFPYKAFMTSNATVLQPFASARPLGANVTEGWAQDHPAFPSWHWIDLGDDHRIEFRRLTPLESLPAWPEPCQPAAGHLPSGARYDWTNVPPLGDAKVGEEIASVLASIQAQWPDVALNKAENALGDTAIRTENSLPVEIPGTFDYVAELDILQGENVVGFLGKRSVVAGRESDWSIERTNLGHSAGSGRAATHPPLLSLSDLWERWGITFNQTAMLYTGKYALMDSTPAFAIRVLRHECKDNGDAVAHHYSLWTGSEILEHREIGLCRK